VVAVEPARDPGCRRRLEPVSCGGFPPSTRPSPRDAAVRDDASDLRRQSVRAGAWAALGAVGLSLTGLVMFVLLSRLLGPREYGLMAIVDIVLAFGQRALSSGLSEPLIQLQKLDDEHSDTLFWTLQVAGLTLAGCVIASSGAIGRSCGQESLPPLLSASAVVLYAQCGALVPGALLARSFRFAEIAKAGVTSELAGGAAGVVAALNGLGVWSLVTQRVVAASVNGILLTGMARWRPGIRWSRRCFRDLWRFSLSRFADGMLLFVDQQFPRLMLGRFAGVGELGQFVFARRIVEGTATLLNSPIRNTALSTFSAIQHDPPRVRRVYAEGLALTTTFVFPACVGIVVMAHEIVAVLAGPRWAASVPLLRLLVLASVRTSFHIWSTALLRGLGRPHLLLGASVTRSLATVVLCCWLWPWGGVGICAAVLAAAYVSWPLALWSVRVVAGIGPGEQFRPCLPAAVATAAMAAVMVAFRSLIGPDVPPGMALSSATLVGACTYASAMAVVGRAEIGILLRNARLLLRGSTGVGAEDAA